VQVIRTIAWILLVCGILTFSFYNWQPVEITIWENLVIETKVPVLLVLAFLAGLLPVLAYHLSMKWSLKRRIRNLEASLKTLATSRRVDPSDGTLAPWGALVPASATASPKKDGSGELSFGGGDAAGDGGDGGGD
jgi:lipopolysaccharide assembly protein A